MDKEITKTKTIQASQDYIVKIETSEVVAYVDIKNRTCTFFPTPDKIIPCEECE